MAPRAYSSTRDRSFLPPTLIVPADILHDVEYPRADSCELWECGEGYANIAGPCLNISGRRLFSDDRTDDDFLSDDEYTVDDDDYTSEIPSCSQAVCCERGEYPSNHFFGTSFVAAVSYLKYFWL